MSDTNPEELAQTALETAIDTINAASDDNNIARIEAENEAVKQFAEAMGEAVVKGLSESAISRYAGALADVALLTNKTDIKSDIDRAIEGAAQGDSEASPLNAYLDDAVYEIDAVRSTDAKQSTMYRWKFSDGDKRYEIETGADTATSHYEWRRIRSAIFDVASVWTTKPPKALRGGDRWSEYIGPFIDGRTNEVTSMGPRTAACDELRNTINRSVAYATIEDMVNHTGVRIDDDPEEGEPSEIWVQYPEVTKICEQYSIKPRGLQVELNARGHTVDRLNGVSERGFVHGNRVSYWVLSADFANPASYDPDPETAVERIGQKFASDETESKTGDKMEPGLIGSTDPEMMGGDGSEIDE